MNARRAGILTAVIVLTPMLGPLLRLAGDGTSDSAPADSPKALLDWPTPPLGSPSSPPQAGTDASSRNTSHASQADVQAGEQANIIDLAYELSLTDPAEALSHLDLISPGDARDNLVIHTVAEWTMRDPESALAWTRELADEVLRDRAIGAIATAWSESQPDAAAQLALTALPPSSARDDALVGIVQRWMQVDPEKAIAWVARLPHSGLRESAINALATLRTTSAPQPSI